MMSACLVSTIEIPLPLTKHDAMDSTQTCACQHAEDRFRDHGHVHDNGISLGDAVVAECTCEGHHMFAYLAIGKGALGIRDGRVVNEGCGGRIMTIDAIVASVEAAARKPRVWVGAAVVCLGQDG